MSKIIAFIMQLIKPYVNSSSRFIIAYNEIDATTVRLAIPPSKSKMNSLIILNSFIPIMFHLFAKYVK